MQALFRCGRAQGSPLRMIFASVRPSNSSNSCMQSMSPIGLAAIEDIPLILTRGNIVCGAVPLLCQSAARCCHDGVPPHELMSRCVATVHVVHRVGGWLQEPFGNTLQEGDDFVVRNPAVRGLQGGGCCLQASLLPLPDLIKAGCFQPCLRVTQTPRHAAACRQAFCHCPISLPGLTTKASSVQPCLRVSWTRDRCSSATALCASWLVFTW